MPAERRTHRMHDRVNTNVDVVHHDTLGMVAIDKNKKMAAAVTTNGATHKIHGSVTCIWI